MSGVVIVAPVNAQWPVRAESALADVRRFVARLYEPRLLPLLVRSGGVSGALIDARTAEQAGSILRECAAIARSIRIVLLHDDGVVVVVDGLRSQPLPTDAAAIVALVAPR